MSYLSNTRLVFSGTFQADVSTVNNDVRHYDNATFEPRFQDRRLADGTENGWFNPSGSGAFRLIGCRVTRVHYQDGTGSCSATEDPAVGLRVGSASDRAAAKMVDLDPYWQLASEIWGLEVGLSAGNESAWVKGQFLHTAFRDIALSRVRGPGIKGGDGAASSSFQSVLEDVVWTDAADRSRVLKELKSAAVSNTLSMRIMTFAYVGKYGDPRFTLGKVCGVIGPMCANEPKTFLLGRRFVAPGDSGVSWNGINFFTGLLDDASSTLMLDLGNAIPLSDFDGTATDIGKLSVGVLRDTSLPEKGKVSAANFQAFGEIDYRQPNWLFDASGIHVQHLTPTELSLARSAPLALAAEQPDGTSRIAIRESANGLFSCAEEFIQRIDAPGNGRVTISTAQYGKPLGGASVVLSMLPPQQGFVEANPSDPNPPKASIPDMYTPADALNIPTTVTSDQEGRATIDLRATSPGNPRRYLDGQIYAIRYRLDVEASNAHAPYDLIVVHVRDSFDVPKNPAWMPDIAPIFTQYGNLYPIMSQRLVDLSDPESVLRNLKGLQLVFSLDIGDPNYMPVTRDLSKNKRIAIQRWLHRLAAEGDPTFVGGPRSAVGGRTDDAQAGMTSTAPDTSEPAGGKTSFARSLKQGNREPD